MRQLARSHSASVPSKMFRHVAVMARGAPERPESNFSGAGADSTGKRRDCTRGAGSRHPEQPGSDGCACWGSHTGTDPQLRRAVHARDHFPTDEATMKLLFLVLNRTKKQWTMPAREWVMAKAQFAVLFGEHFTKAFA